MNQRSSTARIPYGTRDYLPRDARRKRMLEEDLSRLFACWGYREVVCPTYEYLETFQLGSGNNLLQETFKFFDTSNRTLVLRPDMTTPLARIAATRLREEPLPLRLSYLANVFRYELAQAGRQCEFFQGGVELLGVADVAADAEVIALAIEAILHSGLDNFQFSLGQVDFIRGIMDETGLDDEARSQVKQYIITKNLVGLEQMLKGSSLGSASQQLINSIPRLYGKEKVLREAARMADNAHSRQAVGNLQAIYELLSRYGVEKYITFDLGMIRDFNYYTGMVFEGYTPGLGFPVCGGGRYDNLLGCFGFDCPATGFAVGIDRILLALERQGIGGNFVQDSYYVSFSKHHGDAIAKAVELRKTGVWVELALQAEDRKQAEEEQQQKGLGQLVYIE